MVKRFSTVRDTQRGSQSYMNKEEREEGDRDKQGEEKRGSQEERDRSMQYSVP